jgi:hypothetical protein
MNSSFSAELPEPKMKPAGVYPFYSMLDNGTFVSWVCPACKKSNFSSTPGVRNHCRLVHKMIFSSIEDFVKNCGVAVVSTLFLFGFQLFCLKCLSSCDSRTLKLSQTTHAGNESWYSSQRI